MSTIESRIQAKAIEALRAAGCQCFKAGQYGDPDWIVVYEPGKCFFLEFKTEIGTLTSHQKVRFKTLIEQGHRIICSTDASTPLAAVRLLRGS